MTHLARFQIQLGAGIFKHLEICLFLAFLHRQKKITDSWVRGEYSSTELMIVPRWSCKYVGNSSLDSILRIFSITGYLSGESTVLALTVCAFDELAQVEVKILRIYLVILHPTDYCVHF